MADNEKKQPGPPRLALGDCRAARHSLARILRMRFRGEIESDLFRDLCYGLNILLSYDRFEKETELEKRLAALEEKAGLCDMPEDEAARLENELIQDLKKSRPWLFRNPDTVEDRPA